jgi:hypothetical protein
MTDHYIDESGVILAESSPEALDDFGPVIRLEEIEPPPSTFPGSSWTLPDSPSELNPVALAAARLASFLIGQAEDQGMPTTRDGRPVQFLRIQSLRRDDAIAEYRWMTGQPDADPTPEQIRQTQRSRLYVRVGLPNGRDFWVLWQNAPGSPREQGEPDALEKMAMFREWLSRRDPRSPFSDDGALCFDQQQGPQWKHRSR